MGNVQRTSYLMQEDLNRVAQKGSLILWKFPLKSCIFIPIVLSSLLRYLAEGITYIGPLATLEADLPFICVRI